MFSIHLSILRSHLVCGGDATKKVMTYQAAVRQMMGVWRYMRIHKRQNKNFPALTIVLYFACIEVVHGVEMDKYLEELELEMFKSEKGERITCAE